MESVGSHPFSSSRSRVRPPSSRPGSTQSRAPDAHGSDHWLRPCPSRDTQEPLLFWWVVGSFLLEWMVVTPVITHGGRSRAGAEVHTEQHTVSVLSALPQRGAGKARADCLGQWAGAGHLCWAPLCGSRCLALGCTPCTRSHRPSSTVGECKLLPRCGCQHRASGKVLVTLEGVSCGSPWKQLMLPAAARLLALKKAG